MILEIDIGNSRLKWRLLEGGDSVLSGSSEHHSESDYAEIFSEVNVNPESILVASVVPEAKLRLADWCQHHWSLAPRYARVERFCAGVTNGYDDVSLMGVDRWLAMLAAYKHSNSSCLVVDTGSALTVDLLLSNGQHLGGYIVPGLQLMRDALFRDTGRVKTAAIGYDGELAPGHSTQLAVAAGLQSMHLGLILIALDELLVQSDSKPDLYLTGGGAENCLGVMQEFLLGRERLDDIGSIQLMPALVLDGLKSVGYECL